MIKEYKAAIYPFDMEAVELLRHNDIVKNIKFTHVISPSGWGYSKKDASCCDNGKIVGAKVEDDFDKGIEECDTVFFSKYGRKIDLRTIIYPKLIKAAESSKNIICSIDLDMEILDKVSEICKEKGTFFKCFGNRDVKVKKPVYENIYRINKPIIIVAGICERTNKFEVQLNVRKKLQKMGYKVSQVGSRNYCELMGFHSFPEFMYSKEFSESEKITLFNHYIKNIDVNEESDVIIIGIPGGTMIFNNQITNRFGVLTYEVSQAIKPDAVIMNVLYDDYNLDFYERLKEQYKYRFGYDINCFNIANRALNISNSELERSLQYTMLDWKFVEKKKAEYKNLKTQIYNVFNEDDNENMVNNIVDKLSQYEEVII